MPRRLYLMLDYRLLMGNASLLLYPKMLARRPGCGLNAIAQ
jgi:hypothetical protein